MIKAVIFDLDNTLYDYDHCHKLAVKTLMDFCIQTFKISRKEFEETYYVAKKVVKRQAGETGASHNRILYMQNFVEMLGEKPICYSLQMYDVYWNCFLSNMIRFKYVLPVFDYLKANNIKIAILTDLTAHIQHRKLCALNVQRYIDLLVSSEEAGAEKPAECMFELIHDKLKFEKEEIVMIGDSWDKDVVGARSYGFRGFLFEQSHNEKAEKDDEEIISIIRELVNNNEMVK